MATINVAAYAGIAAVDEFERVCKGHSGPGYAPRGSVGRLSLDSNFADLRLDDSMATDYDCTQRQRYGPP